MECSGMAPFLVIGGSLEEPQPDNVSIVTVKYFATVPDKGLAALPSPLLFVKGKFYLQTS